MHKVKYTDVESISMSYTLQIFYKGNHLLEYGFKNIKK